MKNILVLNYEFPPLGGGGSSVSFGLAQEMAHQNMANIDVVTMGFQDLPKYEELAPNFRIHRVKCLRSKKSISYPHEQLSYLFSAYFTCKKLLKKKKYDVCHAHFIIPTAVLARVLLKKYKLPYYVSAHGSDILGYNPRFQKLYPVLSSPWKKIIHNSKGVFCPSSFLEKKVNEQMPEVQRNKTIRIPHGVHSDFFDQEIDYSQKKKQVLLLSRLIDHKGVRESILALLHTLPSDWKVVILGDGPLKKELELEAFLKEKKQYFSFLGWKDRNTPEYFQAIRQSSLFLSASHFESMGLAVLEATACGNVPLLSDIPAHKELFLPEQNISFFSKKSQSEIGKVLKKIFQKDLIEIHDHAKILQEYVQKTYSWEVLARQYDSFFSK